MEYSNRQPRPDGRRYEVTNMMRVWKRLMAALLALALFLPLMAVAEAAETAYGVCLGGSEGGAVKVRKQPAGNSVWFEIPKGHVAEILGEVTKGGSDWYKINTTHPNPNGRTYIGYIKQEFFRPLTAAELEEYLGSGAAPEDPEQPEDPTPDDPAGEEDTEHVEYSGTAVTGGKGRTNATANFRSVPTTKTGKIICEIPSGTEVEITAIPDDTENGWYRVRYNNQSGYVYCDLLDVISAGEPAEDELSGATGEVTADGVRLRAESSTDSAIQAELEEGTVVELLSIPDKISENDWYKVRYQDAVGYIQSNFIRVVEMNNDGPAAVAMGVTVNTNGVNFRTGPGKGYASMGKLTSGIEVEILEIPAGVGENYWYKVRYQGDVGYIQSPYIQVVGQDAPTDPDEPAEPVVSTGVTTSASGVNFRTGEGTGYSIYGKLPLDTVVEILSFPEMIDEDHWYKVRYNGKTGYIMSTFLRVLSVNENDLPEKDYGYAKLITDSSVNLRETPGGNVATKWSGRGSLMRIVGMPSPHGLYSWYPVYHVQRATILYVRDDMIEVVFMKDGEIVEPEPEPESPYGYVITTDVGVNLRIKPAEYVIDNIQIPRNTVLTCVGPTEDASMYGVQYTWYHVKYNGVTGYVRGDCVRVCTATGGDITGDDEPVEDPNDPENSTTIHGYIRLNTGNRVHLRKTAGGDSWGTLAHGTVLPVMGKTEDTGLYFWYPVRDADNRFGWIRGDCAVVCDENGNEIENGELPGPDEDDGVDLTGATGRMLRNTNFRSSPSAANDENIITLIPADTVVTVLRIPEDTEAGWYKITYGGEEGYVYATQIEMITMGGEEDQPELSAFGYVMITGNRVAVRRTASTDGDLLTRVDTNTVWPIIGVTIEKGDVKWFNVEANGHKGYVHGDYAFKLSPTQEESYLAGNGVPEEVPDPEDIPSNYIITVNTNGLNVRESYSQDSASVGRVKSGVVMQFFDTKVVGSVTWYCVLYDHQERWVHGNYAEVLTVADYEAWQAAYPELAPDEGAYLGFLRTTQDNVYIRNAAYGSLYVEKVNKKGTVMRYYSDEIAAGGSGWYQVVTPEGQWGYIRSDLMLKCEEDGSDLPTETPDIGDLTSAPELQQEASYTTLRQGDGGDNSTKGPKVANMVQELINQGYYKGALTNVFTSEVKAAVEAFQSVKGLYVDGIAGSATLHALFGTVPVGAGNTKNLDFAIYPVEKIDWFTGGIQDMIPRGANFKVYDVKTGIVWWAHRWAGGSHADIETLTAADSARLCQIYGVKNLQQIVDDNMWQRRPCLITIGTRTFAASLDGMQHNPKGDTISNNNMDGQICLHFTNSKGHSSGEVSPSHTEAIEYAYNHCPAGKK